MNTFVEFLSDLKFKKRVYHVHPSSREFEGGRMSTLLQGGLRGDACPPSLVLGRVLFEQATVRGNAHYLVDDGRVLELAVRQPNLDNAEILFG